MTSALVRERAADDELEATVFWLSSAIGVALAAIVLAAAWPVAALFREPELLPVLCSLAPILVLSASLCVANARIVRRQRFDQFAAGDFVSNVSSAAVGIGFAFLGAGVWSLVAQQLTLWMTKAAWITVAGAYRPKFIFRFRRARPMLRFSIHNLAGSVADTAGKSIPNLIVGMVLGAAAVGQYAMASQLNRLADTVVAGPVNLAMFSAVAQAPNHRVRAALILTALRHLLILLVPLFLGLLLTADLLVPILLGRSWAATAPALAALVPGAFLLCLFGCIGSALLGVGRSGRYFKLTSLLAVALALGTLVGAQFGVAGAAVGFTMATIGVIPFYLWSAVTRLGISLRGLVLSAAPSFAGGLALLVATVLVRNLSPALPAAVLLVATIAAAAVAYGATVLLAGGAQLRDDLGQLVRRKNVPPAAAADLNAG
jgi:O-antigen/teichoic acid export membrane protein